MNTSLFSWFYYEILENKLSTFFIPHHFDQKVFYEAFGIFDNQIIEKSLVSENPLVRIFALLDRRLGKRRLLALEESMEQELDWVRAFYVIRMQAEGLMEKE